MNDLTIKEAYDIALNIGQIIDEGITVGDNKLAFTMLDYYSISDVDYRYLVRFAKQYKGVESRDDYYYRSLFSTFCERKAVPRVEISDINDIVDEKNAFLVNGEMVRPDLNDIKNVIKTLEENNIPKISRLIYTGLERVAKGYPILPLVDEIENEKQR